MIELACPETCLYLKDARTSTADRWVPRFVQYLMSKDKQALLSALIRFEVLVMILERAIVEVQRYRFRDLSDEEVRQGLKKAIKTQQTLDRGIIYEHKSESPRIQAVTRAILDAVEGVRTDLQAQQRSSLVTTSDFLACLDLISERIEFERRAGEDPQQWLRHAALYQPYPKQETQRLIVTG